MNIFDKEFFPTPPEIIEKMVAPYAERLFQATVLEPSAGRGDILDHICKKGIPVKLVTRSGHEYESEAKAKPGKVYAIEKNPDSQMILQQKGYRVLASDFLTFRPEHRFDLILMNPPFSNGDDHLLHAWDILPSGDIACLLNAETIRNPFSATRKRLAKIIADSGSVEFIGQAFKRAENPTDVEIALVRLHKQSDDDPFRIDIKGYSEEKAPDFGALAEESDQLAITSKLDAYIRCWQLTKASAMDFIKSYARYKFFADALLPKDGYGNMSSDALLKSLKELRFTKESMTDVYNAFLDDTKALAWNSIFAQIGLGRYMTTTLRKKLDDFRTAQGAMEISKENINALFLFIMANIQKIMDQSVVEVYDIFTKYHPGNTAHYEGWKTNKKFRCNRKVILPNAVSAGYMPERFGYATWFSPGYGNDLEDIDKAMCHLEGRSYDSLNQNTFDVNSANRVTDPDNDTIRRVVSSIRVGDQGWHDSAFFRIKAFKKGTIHLEFKEEALWARFNIAVNEGKKQIGMAE